MSSTAPAGAPECSLTQRLDALERANQVRTKRARLKKEIKAGRIPVTRLLMRPPQYVHTMKVIDLLLAAPKCGRVKAHKLLQRCRVSPSKTIGGLTARQRSELAQLITSAAAQRAAEIQRQLNAQPRRRIAA